MTRSNYEGNKSASKLKIVSFNSNSIGKNPKRRQVLNFLKKKNPDVLIVCDTRITTNIENLVKEEWGGQVFFSSCSSQARGVALFLKKDSTIKILDKYKDQEGNLLAVLIEFESKKILLQGVYGPNSDFPEFYKYQAFQKISDWNPNHTILVGDWNVALDFNMDTLNYSTQCNPNSRAEILKQMEELNLVDIFRELKPMDKKFTWKQWGS